MDAWGFHGCFGATTPTFNYSRTMRRLGHQNLSNKEIPLARRQGTRILGACSTCPIRLIPTVPRTGRLLNHIHPENRFANHHIPPQRDRPSPDTKFSRNTGKKRSPKTVGSCQTISRP
jgi:hypothetical protein